MTIVLTPRTRLGEKGVVGSRVVGREAVYTHQGIHPEQLKV